MNLTTGKPSTKHILDLDTLSRININQNLGDITGGWRIEAIIVTNNDSQNASKHAFFIPAQSRDQSRPQPITGRSASVQPRKSNRGYEVPHQAVITPPASSMVNRLEQEAIESNQYLHQKNAIENDLQQSHFRSRSVQYGKEYEIKVKTGEIKGAGTKAAIHVKFFGTG